MTRNILDTIHIKIKELQKNLILLKTISNYITEDNLKEDMLRYWGIERGLQISIECIIDISNIIISVLEIQKPDTYRESIMVLSEHKVISKSIAKEISNMVSFRNILVNDYMKVDEKVMINILQNHLDDFVKFINCINKWVDENYGD